LSSASRSLLPLNIIVHPSTHHATHTPPKENVPAFAEPHAVARLDCLPIGQSALSGTSIQNHHGNQPASAVHDQRGKTRFPYRVFSPVAILPSAPNTTTASVASSP